MKAFNRILVITIVAAVLMIATVNVLLWQEEWKLPGRPYQVEIERLARSIKQEGYERLDLSDCIYVTAVTKYTDDFYTPDSDYAIREIQGELYRFDYQIVYDNPVRNDIVLLNIALALMVVLVIGILLFVKYKVLKPFYRLSDVPYELSKGNLTMPIKESKSRFFGRFVWGVDMLRENMEEQKKRELSLQKENKMLLLSLSHDIKTPLSAIKLYAKALAKGLYENKEKQMKIAEGINTKADEIDAYVSQIIAASREDFLSLTVNPGEFYLTRLMKQMEQYYGEKMELNKITFSIGDYTDCLIRGDLDRSIEVLQNVMENAIKYGDGNYIAITSGQEEDCVLITIENSGCSLPENELDHIFDSFYRGSNVKNETGSGLGLYISRQLMLKMEGEIFASIESGAIRVTLVFPKA